MAPAKKQNVFCCFI